MLFPRPIHRPQVLTSHSDGINTYTMFLWQAEGAGGGGGGGWRGASQTWSSVVEILNMWSKSRLESSSSLSNSISASLSLSPPHPPPPPPIPHPLPPWSPLTSRRGGKLRFGLAFPNLPPCWETKSSIIAAGKKQKQFNTTSMKWLVNPLEMKKGNLGKLHQNIISHDLSLFLSWFYLPLV